MSTKSASDTLARILQLIQLIPKAPAQVTANDLTDELHSLGFSVSLRTVHRDLNEISQILPLYRNSDSKPYGWKWPRDSKTHFALMSLQEALTLNLVNQHLMQVLPPNMFESLNSMFTQAKQTLESLGDKNKLNNWLESALVEQPTQHVISPKVDIELQEEVYKALFDQRPLNALYKPKNSKEAREYLLHPVGLMQRGQVTYLGAMVEDYDDILLFALHRFTQAEINHLAMFRKSKTSWKEFLSSGKGGFGGDSVTTIKLKAIIDTELATILDETPISQDQKISDTDGSLTLKATLQDTWQFRWWILSQGSKITIQEPQELAQSIKEELEKALNNY